MKFAGMTAERQLPFLRLELHHQFISAATRIRCEMSLAIPERLGGYHKRDKEWEEERRWPHRGLSSRDTDDTVF